uniref:phage/plasmid primase, P4 family n=1 Tax=Pararhizobium sp. IMCC3301 TaxID=3067904 RepID=UPI002740FFDE|nr:phage/plasmid primase, P4 family [Pararhizobium sp. IMCC3301]
MHQTSKTYHKTSVSDKPSLPLSDLADALIWVAWRETNEGRKLPVNPATGRAAKSDDPDSWGTRKAAYKRTQNSRWKREKTGQVGVGVMFGPLAQEEGWRLCGVDLDGCRDPDTCDLEPWAEVVVDRFASFTETSPSGTGVHILFLASESDFAKLRDSGLVTDKGGAEFSLGDHTEIALFMGGRYFTVTEDLIREESAIRAVPLKTLRWLVRDHGPAFKRGAGKAATAGSGDDSGSGLGFKFLCDRFREGFDEDEARAAIGEDAGDAGAWWQRAGDRQQDRTVQNARKRITGEGAEIIDLFDDLDDPDVEAAYILGVEPDTDSDFELDEDGVIRAFTAAHKDELRFDHAAGSWFRFDGNSWRREETKLAHHYARKLATDMADDDPKAKALRKVSVWEAIERGARTVREFVATAADWNRDPWLLGTPRGTVDLRTGSLSPGRPDDHISRLTAVAPIPLERFDAERDCPRWLAFLDEALDGDAEAIRFLRMWGGYSLSGETKEHALVFVYGPGGSGKSTAINTVADILGEYAINVATSTLTAARHDAHPEEIARLDGARLAWASETEKGRAWAENRIKSLTGGDKITARFMRQNSFEFTPQMKLVIVGNNAPTLTSVDEAVKRRFIILPFDHPPKSKDTNLPAKLREEWPGILSWMIEGCLDWQAHGLVRPAVAERATEAYFAEQDIFAQWIEDCCTTGKHEADTTGNLWDSWSAYAYENGEAPGTRKRSFPETLSQRGFEAIKNTNSIRGRGYRGIRVAVGQVGDFDVL